MTLAVIVIGIAAQTATAAPGELDTTFDPGPILWQGFAFPSFKYAVVLQPDGKVIIGGQFDTVQGVPRILIARLNTNGSLDASFNSPIQTIPSQSGPQGEVYDVLQQPDGKFIVSGYFLVGGVWKTVVRLNNDGSLDGSFNVTTNDGSTDFNHVYRALLQPDGKIIIASNALQSVNGVTTNRIARLTSTGSLDAPLGVTGNVLMSVFALGLQTDGKIVVGGGDSIGTAITRLNADGTVDGGFTPPELGLVSIHSLAIEPDGQILVGANGRQTVNGNLTDALIRLNANGTFDPGFNPPDIRTCWTLYVQDDGKIAVGGTFTINFGLALSTFGRINPEGSLDFISDSGPDNDLQNIVRQPDGKYLVTGTFENFDQGNNMIPRTGVARILEAPSPLAGKIVYDSRPTPTTLEIRSMNADGTGQTSLTTSGADYDPSVSADGSKIAFVSLRDDKVFEEIFVMNSDGSGQTRLTNDNFVDIDPSISADGTKIAFASLRDGNWEIYSMNANGSNLTRLTNNAFRDDQPTFSPDGTKIVFRSDRDGNQEIYVMNVDGSTQARLTNNVANDTEPVFSPDGTRIAFRTFRDGNSEIYVMSQTGSRQWNISRDPAIDSNPAFSPDGSRIVFATNRNAGHVEIYVMNWGGSDPVRYTNNSVEDGRPSWGGDGALTPPPSPAVKMKVEGGNILLGSAGEGLIFKTPNGTCQKLSINNAGAIVLGTVTCQ
jgi:uncharacterized delta-60 repeat protein